MWAAAAEATTGPDSTLIVVIGTFLGVVVTTVGAIIVQAIKSRADRTSPSPPAPAADGSRVAERLAVLEYQAKESQERDDDADQRDDMQDRALRGLDDRVEAVEKHLDRTDPGWRH